MKIAHRKYVVGRDGRVWYSMDESGAVKEYTRKADVRRAIKAEANALVKGGYADAVVTEIEWQS